MRKIFMLILKLLFLYAMCALLGASFNPFEWDWYARVFAVIGLVAFYLSNVSD